MTARKSRIPFGYNSPERNPIANRSLKDDLPQIRRQADLWELADEDTKKILGNFVFEGHSLDYYHGQYTGMYQAYVLDSHTEQKNLEGPLGGIVHLIAHKILKIVELNEKIFAEMQLPK